MSSSKGKARPLLLVFVISFSVSAQAAGQTEEVEEIEIADVVEVVESSPGGTANSFGPLKILGRMHSAMVHMPIGFLFALLLLEMFAMTKFSDGMGNSGLFLCGATVLSAIPAGISGFLRVSEIFLGRGVSDLAIQHRNTMIALFVVLLAAFVLRFVKRKQFDSRIRMIYLATLFAASAIAGYGGHLGGKMVFGEGFLPF